MNTKEGAGSRPRGRRYALPLAGSSILLAAAGGGLSLLAQLYLKERGASVLLISVVSSLGSAGILLGSLTWGRLSDRASRRLMLVLTALGVAVGVGMLVPLPSSSVVIGSSFLRAFMDVGFAAVALAIVSSASAEARRGRNLSYISSARSLGFAMGALGGGFLLEMLGFRNAFALMAVLPIAALLFVAVLPSGARPEGARRQAAWALLRSTGLTDLYVGTILRQVAINGAFSLLYVYMAILGIPPGMMGAVSALNTLTQVLALVLFGFVADRIGRRRVFLLGFALSALVPCILAVATNVIWMAAAYVTLGLSFSSLYVGSTAHIGDRVPQERQGTMLGLYETSRGLGGVVGPLVAGALAPMAGFRGMFLAMGGIAVLSFLVMFVGRFRVRWNQRFGP